MQRRSGRLQLLSPHRVTNSHWNADTALTESPFTGMLTPMPTTAMQLLSPHRGTNSHWNADFRTRMPTPPYRSAHTNPPKPDLASSALPLSMSRSTKKHTACRLTTPLRSLSSYRKLSLVQVTPPSLTDCTTHRNTDFHAHTHDSHPRSPSRRPPNSKDRHTKKFRERPKRRIAA